MSLLPAQALPARVRLIIHTHQYQITLTPPQSIVHNGHLYKTLADHDPQSVSASSEYTKLFNLDPAWQICPKTADALHVCATHPWASYALVFADGSANWTHLAKTVKNSLVPGACT